MGYLTGRLRPSRKRFKDFRYKLYTIGINRSIFKFMVHLQHILWDEKTVYKVSIKPKNKTFKVVIFLISKADTLML